MIIGDSLLWAPIEGNQNRTVKVCLQPLFPMIDFTMYKGAETHKLTELLWEHLQRRLWLFGGLA